MIEGSCDFGGYEPCSSRYMFLLCHTILQDHIIEGSLTYPLTLSEKAPQGKSPICHV